MKPHPAHRAGRQQIAAPSHHVPSAVPVHHAPNAALLIDFDNVTLGIRSDLAKELRTLLNSDIIKGKVAVQRAYADWRRYPQYIVSLSESSIDLIFAPAFGTNKKNATDIRLAVDAIELVFTRPEIGTFMLLSGDSDFSSLVLKLKEYGKYVIGVGIRESASDILIQNCDEYYSYSDLAGLSKEADVASPPRDPWELVVDAVEQMARNHDVMRADRLKQVMQQIDPAFDESNAGYNRFSKFVTEAGTRGLIRVIKQDNGQLDVAPGATSSPAPAARRGREASVLSERAPAAALPAEKDAASHPVRRRRGGRGRGRSPDAGEVTAKPAISGSAAGGRASTGLTLAEAFHLLARALGELPAPVPHEALRARMAALHGKEDSLLEPLRFAKLLRQANDAEIADIRMVAEDQYEISPHKADLAFKMQARPPIAAVTAGETAAPAAVRPAAALRFRGGSRTGTRPSELQMVGVVELNAGTPAQPSAPGIVAATAVSA
ncbi:MAG: NYN domain-containing protein, partial [Gemmatimonadales bacterium]